VDPNEEDSGVHEPAEKDEREPQGSKRANLVAKAIESMEHKLAASDVKATFGDFIRLLQLQKELQIEQPREIKITWIDPTEKKESASEE
jgi:hypothetical protein